MRIHKGAILTFGLTLLGSSAALAQNCGSYGGYIGAGGPPSETVTVTAPPPSMERARLNTAPERVYMSERVSYADLNLCTGEGEEALRARVRAAAEDVCRKVDAVYPHTMNGPRSCYRDATADANPKTDFAIAEARGLR
jgi:UrcA family protein